MSRATAQPLAALGAKPALTQLSTLQISLLISVGLHAALLLVRLADPEGFNRVFKDTPLEVVLVNSSSATRPDKPQVIAQRNLAGGGEALNARATSPLPPSLQTETGDSAEEAHKQIDQLQEQQLQLLSQIKAELAKLSPPDPKRDEGDPKQRADDEKRRQLVEQVGQIEKRIKEENSRPKKRFVSPSAVEGVHALYYDSLRRKIEETGTRNFPQAGGRKLYGELTMLVTVNDQGQVVDAEIKESSGNRILDRRAISIVRAASPYGRFTTAMREQFDQLVFASRFRFERDEALRTTVSTPLGQ
ncbi:MAG TPA: TonB family protein [Burkholderiaceae bacterium]|nr:TonB family protein [Burkholderiaceae bacterium]